MLSPQLHERTLVVFISCSQTAAGLVWFEYVSCAIHGIVFIRLLVVKALVKNAAKAELLRVRIATTWVSPVVKIADGISVANVLQKFKTTIAKSYVCFLCQHVTILGSVCGLWRLKNRGMLFRLKGASPIDAIKSGSNVGDR